LMSGAEDLMTAAEIARFEAIFPWF
jgi:hypothetical protein